MKYAVMRDDSVKSVVGYSSEPQWFENAADAIAMAKRYAFASGDPYFVFGPIRRLVPNVAAVVTEEGVTS